MKKESHLRLFIPMIGGMFVLALAAVLMMVAWPAAAGVQEDSFAYLPYITSPLVPVDEYETDFNEGIDTWSAVRWYRTASYDVKHNQDCIAGHCGFLDVRVKSNNSYAIVSPLIPGPTRSYAVTFRAKIEDPEDKDQYGAVFSGDVSEPPCPDDNTTNCFNRYYDFRARYRNTDGEKYVEYRLRRIEGHDSNNVAFGEELIDWTKAEGVNPDEWTKWEIRFRSSGHIFVKANNKEQPANARDNHFHDQRQFGLIVQNGQHMDTLVHFDNFKIVKED